MMIAKGKAANALGGKTARACDSCLKKRARWFCAADDAFLCQGCDTFVHSANQLASRHERILLETSAVRAVDGQNVAPTWQQGFTRKARTPRNTKPALLMMKENANSLPLVPEISGDEASHDESEEQILCRVPVLEPLPFASTTAELCNELNDEMMGKIQADDDHDHQLNVLLTDDVDDHDLDIPVFIASDAELAEFATDVESLLGTGIDDDIHKMEALEVVGNEEEGNNLDACFEVKRVKVEDQDDQEVQAVIACHFDPALDMARESLTWDFHFSSPLPGEEEEAKVTNDEMPLKDGKSKEVQKRMTLLKLNYETVISAWARQGSSPWAAGTKPEFNSDECWPDFMGTSPWELHHTLIGAGGGRIGGRDEKREARVLRYREKRRRRLFSKKIRYEVRKLNAEKRPRMKGRFVKRTSFPYLMNK